MIKFGLIGCLAITICLLGLKVPDSPPKHSRDVVPATQKVAHSSHCAGCHGYDDTAMALVDQDGHDVNIFDDWQISMMGMSAHDPFWRATLAHEVNIYPGAREAIESTCLKCHAPLGNIQAHLDGKSYSYNDMLGDTLGLDGVSCSSCHQQPMENLGKGNSGNFSIDTNRLLFGHFPNPFKGPMQIYVGFEPTFSDHIYSSGVCAGCHTLITQTLDTTGLPTGNSFVEQATYHEWLNSSYPQQNKECQTCHLPFIPGEVVIATDFLALEGRQPFGLHQFFGANTAMLSLMRDHKDDLLLPIASSDDAWTESINNNRISLQKATDLVIGPATVTDDTLYFRLSITNKTGHKFPSGYPNRLAWIEVILLDQETADTIYANGLMDTQGHIIGRDYPVEPHHEICRSPEDVQIYELAMSDAEGQLTTRLNAAFQPLKDNRILPLGFRKDNPVYDTVAIWGNALSDVNYSTESMNGKDDIEYRISLQGHMGFGDLQVSLHYQTLPPRWMEDIFTDDTLPQVSQFKSMYGDYAAFQEVINSLEVNDIDLNPVAVLFPEAGSKFLLTPNPVEGRTLHLQYPDGDKTSLFQVRIFDLQGHILLQNKLAPTIDLPANTAPAMYYFSLWYQDRMVYLQRFLVL
jgi:hypothetical protein